MNATLLAETERILRKHDPASFDTAIDAWPESIEYVRVLEDEAAWKAAYPSLEAFHAAHEERHPDIRFYSRAVREIESRSLLEDGYESPSAKLARLRAAD
jgi:hypothetical protein